MKHGLPKASMWLYRPHNATPEGSMSFRSIGLEGLGFEVYKLEGLGLRVGM